MRLKDSNYNATHAFSLDDMRSQNAERIGVLRAQQRRDLLRQARTRFRDLYSVLIVFHL